MAYSNFLFITVDGQYWLVASKSFLVANGGSYSTGYYVQNILCYHGSLTTATNPTWRYEDYSGDPWISYDNAGNPSTYNTILYGANNYESDNGSNHHLLNNGGE